MNKIFVLLNLAIIALSICVSAAEIVNVDESPINLEDYFSGGDHYNTVGGGSLELMGGADSGHWSSPVFRIADSGLSGMWNHLDFVANWDDFTNNYADENPGFEDGNLYWVSYHMSGNVDVSRSHSGTRSYKIIPTHDSGKGAFYPLVTSGAGIESQHNIMPVEDGDTVHITYWIDADMQYGEITPMVYALREQGGIFSYYGKLATSDFSDITSTSTDGFVRVQAEFNIDVPDDGYDYYAYPFINFKKFEPEAPDANIWIDDVRFFKDSPLRIQARSGDNCDSLPGWSEWSERLVYENHLTVPAPVGKCVQLRLLFDRMTGVSPILQSGRLTFSKGYEWTRPREDIYVAEFNYPEDEYDEVSLGSDGDLYKSSGEKIRFSGIQFEQNVLDMFINWYGETEGPERAGDYVCGFAEKYGLNLVKTLPHWDGFTESDIREILNDYAPTIARCKESNIYFMAYLTPLAFLNQELGHNLADNGYGGPVEFVSDAVVEKYKEYLDIVFLHDFQGTEIEGTRIAEDNAFVFTSLINERSLVMAWTDDRIDGVYGGIYTGQQKRELSSYWAEVLRSEQWEPWVRSKYPTYAQLCSAWGGCSSYDEAPFIDRDGICTQANYDGQDSACHISIMNYGDWWTSGMGQRARDTLQFLVEREEEVYTELRNHIQQTLGSNSLVAGGVSPWSLFPAATVSAEALDTVNVHTYMPTVEMVYNYDPETGLPARLQIHNNPLISNYNNMVFGEHLLRGRLAENSFIIGEITYTPHSEHIPEQILLSLIGGNSGYDAYSLFHLDARESDFRMTIYSIFRNSPLIALQPTASRLFRRDVDKASTRKMYLTYSNALSFDPPKPYAMNAWIDPANMLKYDLSWGSFHASANTLPPLQDAGSVIVSDAYTYYIESRKVLIHTPMTQGAVGDLSVESLDDFSFSLVEDDGLPTHGIFLTSLDDTELASSERMLLTLVSIAENSDQMWDTYHKNAWKASDPMSTHFWGEMPVWMAGVNAQISINANRPATVYPLDKYGRKTSQYFVVEPSGGELVFDVGPEFKTPWFLLELEPDTMTDEEVEQNIAEWLIGNIGLNEVMSIIKIWKLLFG